MSQQKKESIELYCLRCKSTNWSTRKLKKYKGELRRNGSKVDIVTTGLTRHLNTNIVCYKHYIEEGLVSVPFKKRVIDFSSSTSTDIATIRQQQRTINEKRYLETASKPKPKPMTNNDPACNKTTKRTRMESEDDDDKVSEEDDDGGEGEVDILETQKKKLDDIIAENKLLKKKIMRIEEEQRDTRPPVPSIGGSKVVGSQAASSVTSVNRGSLLSPKTLRIFNIYKAHMLKKMKGFVRNEVYGFMKFGGRKDDLNRDAAICRKAIYSRHLEQPDGINSEQLIEYFKHKVRPILNQLRHNSQTLARRNWIDDHKEKMVPLSFPGTVNLLIWEDNNTGVSSVGLNDNYRRYGDAKNEEFYYFVTRILTAINPRNADFRRQKNKKTISEMFTVTDEAFGLMILYNEYHVWSMQQKAKDGKVDELTAKKTKKRFVDAKSGKRDGWDDGGRNLFNKLCREIDALRKAPTTGKVFEDLMRDRFRAESSENNDNKGSVSGIRTQQDDVIEDDFCDESFLKALNEA